MPISVGFQLSASGEFLFESLERSMKKYNLRLALIDGWPNFVADNAPSGAEDFAFQLCHREIQFGNAAFKHWWMDIRSIYPTRGRVAVNFEPIVKYWWQSCLAHGTNNQHDVCESYILANLFLKTRSTGSRRVLLDSISRRGNMAERREYLANLDEMLTRSFGDEKSIIDFSRHTGRMLGQPDYSEEVYALYREFTDELFGDTVQHLVEGREHRAVDVADDVWRAWTKRYGRRGNVGVAKHVIDILSYEARATVHRCYSNLWVTISDWLSQEHNCTLPSQVFHRFWNLDVQWPGNEFDGNNFHLFHGHIIGLHPASAVFVQSATGKQLIGEWLDVAPNAWERSTNPETPQLRRLLNGLYIAVSFYADQLGTANLLRRKQPDQMPVDISFSNVVGDGSGFGRAPCRHKRKKLAE